MKLSFAPVAWDQYHHWLNKENDNTFERLNKLIEECKRTPFKGTGKPEPLKGDWAGYWSRRITIEDRLVYKVSGTAPDQTLFIAQCRFHYDEK